MTILKIPSIGTGPIVTKFHIEPPSFLIRLNRSGHMPNMTAMSIYGMTGQVWENANSQLSQILNLAGKSTLLYRRTSMARTPLGP